MNDNKIERMIDKVIEARGQGQGVGGPRQGDGGASKCKCTECGHIMEHTRGVPCTEMSCPECGSSMVGV